MDEARVTLSPGMEVTKAVRLVKPLGVGGMGAVWLGEHTGLKTHVVVKFMIEAFDRSATARARFSREAAAAAQVKSPHVVQMLDHGVTDDGIAFIVMEHLEGKDLGQVLAERGHLEPREVVVIVSQVAKALSKVHAAGLLHRDIKPSNIFLVDGEDDLFVKLLDFGIAKAQVPESERDAITLDGETKTGQIVGTPYYMSPEQVTAQKSVDHRADLWSLGVVAWELLVGHRPFDGPSFGALAVAIASGPLPSAPPPLPPTFDAWFAKACAREPAQRFASARQLAEGLRAAFDAASFSLPPATPLGDSGSGDRPKPELALAKTMQSELAKSEPGAVAVTPQPKKGAPLGAIAGGAVAVAIGFAVWSSQKSEPTTRNAPSSTAGASIAIAPPSVPAPPVSVVPSAATPTAEPLTSASAPIASAQPSASPPKPDAGAGTGTTATVVKPPPSAHPIPTPPKPSHHPANDDPLY